MLEGTADYYFSSYSQPRAKEELTDALIILSKKDIAPFLEGMESKNDNVREISARVTGISGNSAALAPLIRLLDDSNNEVVHVAIRSLGSFHERDAAKALYGALKKTVSDEKSKVSKEALVDSLSSIGEPSISVVIDDLSHKTLGEYARSVLIRIGRPAVPFVIQKLEHWHPATRKAAIDVLAGIGEPAIPALVEAFGSGSYLVREAAQGALIQIGKPEASAVYLIRGLTHETEDVRWRSAIALASLPHPSAIGSLIRALEDSSPRVRKNAAIALALSGDARGGASLVLLLKDPDAFTRRTAVTGLGLLDAKPAVGELSQLLDDPDSKVRREAALTLGKLSVPKTIADLLKHKNDSDPLVRRAIASALGRFEKEPRIIRLQEEYLNDPSFDVRLAAAFSLERLGVLQANEGTRTKLLSSSDDLRKQGREEVTASKDAKTLAYLATLLLSENSSERDLAKTHLTSLGEMGAKTLLFAVQSGYRDWREAATPALREMKEAGAEALVRELGNTADPAMRSLLIESLGSFEKDDTVNILYKVIWQADDPELAGVALSILWKVDYQESQKVFQNLRFREKTLPDLINVGKDYLPYYLLSIALLGLGMGSVKFRMDLKKRRKTSPILKTVREDHISSEQLARFRLTAEGSIRYQDVETSNGKFGRRNAERLLEVIEEVRRLGYDPALRGIREIEIVQNHDRMAHAMPLTSVITLDVDLFRSSKLLLMELEHELGHLMEDALPARAPPSHTDFYEEFSVSLQEVRRFLTFSPMEQDEVLRVLESDKGLDQSGFHEILELARKKGFDEAASALLEYLARSLPSDSKNGKKLNHNFAREILPALFDQRGREILLKQGLNFFSRLREKRAVQGFMRQDGLDPVAAKAIVILHEKIRHARLNGNGHGESVPLTIRDLRRFVDFYKRFAPVWGRTRAVVYGAFYIYGSRGFSDGDQPEILAALKEVDLDTIALLDEATHKVRMSAEGVLDEALNGVGKIASDGQTVRIGRVKLPVNYDPLVPSRVPFKKTSGMIHIPRTVRDLETIAEAVALNHPLLLVGETGAGKTSLIRHLASLTNNGFLRLNLNGQTDKDEFLGSHKPVRRSDGSAGFEWHDGILIEAMRSGDWLVLDEINLADPAVIERVRYLLESEGYLVLSEHEGEKWISTHAYDRLIREELKKNPGRSVEEISRELQNRKIFKIHPNFRLFATMNPPSEEYEGRKRLSEAMMNKFMVKWIPELSATDIRMILEGRYGWNEKQLDLGEALYKELRTLSGSDGRIAKETGEIYCFTVRHFLRLAERLHEWEARRAKSSSESEFKKELGLEAAYIFRDGIQSERSREIFNQKIGKILPLPFDGRVIDAGDLNGGHMFQVGETILPVDLAKRTLLREEKLALVPATRSSLDKIARAVSAGERPLLVGPTGASKTSLVRYLANRTGREFKRVNLDAFTDTSELIGKDSPAEGTKTFEWSPGILLRAMEAGDWVLLDEFNLAEPEILERLNSLFDDEGSLTVTEHKGEKYIPSSEFDSILERYSLELQKLGRTKDAAEQEAKARMVTGGYHRIHPDFRLFAAMNPEKGYAGRRRLSLAIRNKFTEIWVSGELKPEETDEVARFYLTEPALFSGMRLPDDLAGKAAPLMRQIHEGVLRLIREHRIGALELARGEGEDYSFSLREIKDWADFIRTEALVIGKETLAGQMIELEEDIRRISEKIPRSTPDSIEKAEQEADLLQHTKTLDYLKRMNATDEGRREWGLSRTIIEGALYIYRDRLQSESDREIFRDLVLKEVMTSEAQRVLGGEEVDIQGLDILEESLRGLASIAERIVSEHPELAETEAGIELLVLRKRFWEFTSNFPQKARDALNQIMKNLERFETAADGVRGFAMLPIPEKKSQDENYLSVVETLTRTALFNSRPDIRKAAIEVAGHRRIISMIGEIVPFLEDPDQGTRLTAALVLVERLGWQDWKKEANDRIKKRPGNLSFRETISRLIKSKEAGDYLGLFAFLKEKRTLASIACVAGAVSVFMTPYLLGAKGYSGLLALISYPLSFLAVSAGIGLGLALLFKLVYAVIYLPQYLLLNKRYRSLPLTPDDFYALLERKGTGDFLRSGISAQTVSELLKHPAARLYSLSAVALGAVWGWFFLSHSGADALPVIPIWLAWPPVLWAITMTALGFTSYFVASLLPVGILMLKEMIYAPLRSFVIERITSKTDAFFKPEIPYSKETQDLLRGLRHQIGKRLEKTEDDLNEEDFKAVLKGNVIRKTDQGLLINTILIPYGKKGAVSNDVPVDDESTNLIPVLSTVRNVKKLALAIQLNDPVLLIGESGVGKTSLVRYLAAQTRHNFKRFNLNGQTDKTEFVGGFKPGPDGRFRWVDGILVKAMEAGHWLVLDEINLADSQVIERINSLLDDDRELRLTEQGNVIWIPADRYDRKLAEYEAVWKDSPLAKKRLYEDGFRRIHPDFRLFAAMNPSDYAGRKLLSPALLNRFRVKWVNNFTDLEEKAILNERFPDELGNFIFGISLLKSLIQGHVLLSDAAFHRRVGNLESDPYYFTLRDLLRVMRRAQKRIAQAGPFGATELVAQEFTEVYTDRIRQDSERRDVRFAIIENVFREDAKDDEKPVAAKSASKPLALDDANDEIKTANDKVFFGDISLDINRAVTPHVPGNEAELFQTKTTRKLLKKIAKSVAMREPVLLIGETGVAKTSLIRDLAHRTGNSFIRMSLDAQTDTSEIIGKFVPVDGGEKHGKTTPDKATFAWHPGELAKALKNGWWVLFDEVNLAEPDILERINSLLDDDGSIVITENENEKYVPLRDYEDKVKTKKDKLVEKGVPSAQAEIEAKAELEANRIFPIHPGFRLFAAMNPEHYSGRNRLSLAMRNKFQELWVPERLPDGEVHEILNRYLARYTSLSAADRSTLARKMTDFHNQLAQPKNELEQKAFSSYRFSMRELKSWARFIGKFSNQEGTDQAALHGARYFYGDQLKHENDRKLFDQILERTFGEAKKEDEVRIEAGAGRVKIDGVELNQHADSARPLVPTEASSNLVLTPKTVRELEKVARSIVLDDPLLLVGETGAGKTSLIRYLAYLTRSPFLRLNLSGQTEKTEFLGKHHPDEAGEFTWSDGMLIQAMREGQWLVLDEINLAPAQVVERLNSLLDDDGFVIVTEHEDEKWMKPDRYDALLEKEVETELGKGNKNNRETLKLLMKEHLDSERIFRIHSDFRLFATMNPAENYAGRQLFSPALMNRFRQKWIDVFDEAELRAIALGKYGASLPQNFIEQALRFHMEAGKLARNGFGKDSEASSQSDAIVLYTVRHLIRWLDRVKEIRQNPAHKESLNQAAVREGFEIYADGLSDGVAFEARLRDWIREHLEKAFQEKIKDDEDVQIREEKDGVWFGDVFFKRNGVSETFVPALPLKRTQSTKKLMRKIVRAARQNEPILFKGPTGTGKTAIVKEVADLLHIPFIPLDLDGQSDTGQIIGRMLPSEDKKTLRYEWQDGFLIQAMERGWWILLDEINLAEPEVIERINSLLDDDRTLTLSEHNNRTIKVHPNFRLFAAMNPDHMEGRKMMSQAMLNKFHLVWVGDDKTQAEKEEIVTHYFNQNGVASMQRSEARQEGEKPRSFLQTMKTDYRNYLMNRVVERARIVSQFFGADFNVRMEPGDQWQINMKTKPMTIMYPEEELLSKGWRYSVGAAIHEGSHRRITWFTREWADNVYRHFLHNAVEDVRVNRWALYRAPNAARYLKVLYSKAFPEDPKEKFDDYKTPLHVQYGLGLIHEWYYGTPHPSITNPKVIQALKRTRKDLVEAHSQIPGSVRVSREDDKLVFERPVLRGFARQLLVMPKVGKQLLIKDRFIQAVSRPSEHEFILTTALGQELLDFRRGESFQFLVDMNPNDVDVMQAQYRMNRILEEKIRPVYDELVQEARQNQMKGMARTGQGRSGAQGSAQGQAEGELEQKTKSYSEKLEPKFPRDLKNENVAIDKRGKETGNSAMANRPLERMPNGTVNEQEGSSQEQGKSDGAREGQQKAQGAAQKSPAGPEKQGRSQSSQAGEQSSQTRSAKPAAKGGSPSDKSRDMGTQGEPASQETQRGASQEGQPLESVPNDEFRKQFGQDARQVEQYLSKSIEARKIVPLEATDYSEYFAPVAPLVQQLFGLLENQLHKDIKPTYKGDFETGTKLNLRKAMTMPVTGDTKIWKRRIKPVKRSFKFSLVVDESGSMDESVKRINAIHSLVLIQEVLSRLDIDFSIVGFSNSPTTHKNFSSKFKHLRKEYLLSEILASFNRGGGTNDGAAVSEAVRQLTYEDGESRIAIVITDGEGNGETPLSSALEEAKRKGIKVVGIGIGDAMHYVKTQYRPYILVPEVRELPKVLAKLLIDIIVYKKPIEEVGLDSLKRIDLERVKPSEPPKPSPASDISSAGEAPKVAEPPDAPVLKQSGVSRLREKLGDAVGKIFNGSGLDGSGYSSKAISEKTSYDVPDSGNRSRERKDSSRSEARSELREHVQAFDVKEAIAKNLLGSGEITAPDQAQDALKKREEAIYELIKIGKPAVLPLINALASSSLTTRLGAIQALAAIGDQRAIGSLNQLAQAVELKEAARLAVQTIEARPGTSESETVTGEKNQELHAARGDKSRSFEIPSVGRVIETFDSKMALSLVETLLRQTTLKVDLDVESLMEKNEGRVRLLGWGFMEILKTLEEKLPNEFLERIKIRLVNLNPAIRTHEIEQAFGITPELRSLVEITNVPVRHMSFMGIEPFIGKDALKIASEHNLALWKEHADILVKAPGKDELIDGRKLFLMALLHRALGRKLSGSLQIAAEKLLRELGGSSDGKPSYFTAENKAALGMEFISQMDRANKLLASMA